MDTPGLEEWGFFSLQNNFPIVGVDAFWIKTLVEEDGIYVQVFKEGSLGLKGSKKGIS